MSSDLKNTSGTTTPNTTSEKEQEFYENKAMFRIALQLKYEGEDFNDAVKMAQQLATVDEFNKLVILEKKVLQNHDDNSKKEAIEEEMQTLVENLAKKAKEAAEKAPQKTKEAIEKEAIKKEIQTLEQTLAKKVKEAKKAIKNARQRTTKPRQMTTKPRQMTTSSSTKPRQRTTSSSTKPRQRTTSRLPGSTKTGGKRRKPRKTKKHRKKKSL